MTQQIEIYLDSYRNKPIVTTIPTSITINLDDEISQDEWRRLLDAQDVLQELKVKVENVLQCWDRENLRHAISIRVVPVE